MSETAIGASAPKLTLYLAQDGVPVTGATADVSIQRESDGKWYDFLAEEWDTVEFASLGAEHKFALVELGGGVYQLAWDQGTADPRLEAAYMMYYRVLTGDLAGLAVSERWQFVEGDGSASGAAEITLFVKKDGVLTEGVPVTLQATGGNNVKATDANGEVTFNRDDGDWNYAIEDTASYLGSSGTVTVVGGVVTSPVDGILTVTAVSLPSAAADCYALYGIEDGLDGNVRAGAGEVTVTVVDCDERALYAEETGLLRRLLGAEFETDASGMWSINIAQDAVEKRGQIALEFTYTTGVPLKVIKWAVMDETVANEADQIAFAAWKPKIRKGIG
jgi:hypothetical protein